MFNQPFRYFNELCHEILVVNAQKKNFARKVPLGTLSIASKLNYEKQASPFNGKS